MSFRLVDLEWAKELEDALATDNPSIWVVCPFIKRRAAERLLKRGTPKKFKVITRFNLRDFSDGVSDISALRLLLENGARIRGVRNLHAKLYLFNEIRVMVTSANLTDAALLRNHEFGFVAEDAGIVDQCRVYFDTLWCRAGQDLQLTQLVDWEERIGACLTRGAPPRDMIGLGDEGVDAGIAVDPLPAPWAGSADQAFVKFFGESDNRADRFMTVFDEVKRSGCHWACTYPYGKRPRQVRDGAIMFMGRLVKEPDDILIYGRAIGMRHNPARDDATAEDIQERDWKAKWPHYVRVHHAEFVNGTMTNGVSLNELMERLQADAFESTQRHARNGMGNTDPRRAYRQQAAVKLSREGLAWLSERLERAYTRYGKLAPVMLEQLDWPAVP